MRADDVPIHAERPGPDLELAGSRGFELPRKPGAADLHRTPRVRGREAEAGIVKVDRTAHNAHVQVLFVTCADADRACAVDPAEGDHTRLVVRAGCRGCAAT